MGVMRTQCKRARLRPHRVGEKNARDLIVLGLFILVVLVNLYDAISFDYSGVNKNLFIPYSVFEISLNNLLYVLTYFGCFISIIIGFSCIASDRHNNALNVLMTKPLYRDTIINGKIIGTFYFLICVYGLTVLLFMSSFLLLYGNILESSIIDYLARIALILVIAVIYSLIYVSLSIMIALLVKSQALALVLSMMAIIIINYINSTTFAGYIGLIASGLFGMNPDRVAYMIDHLSPKWSIDMILLNVRAFNPVARHGRHPFSGRRLFACISHLPYSFSRFCLILYS